VSANQPPRQARVSAQSISTYRTYVIVRPLIKRFWNILADIVDVFDTDLYIPHDGSDGQVHFILSVGAHRKDIKGALAYGKKNYAERVVCGAEKPTELVLTQWPCLGGKVCHGYGLTAEGPGHVKHVVAFSISVIAVAVAVTVVTVAVTVVAFTVAVAVTVVGGSNEIVHSVRAVHSIVNDKIDVEQSVRDTLCQMVSVRIGIDGLFTYFTRDMIHLSNILFLFISW
jgi:hypothetical protein